MNPLELKPKTDKKPSGNVEGRPRQWLAPNASGKRMLNPKWKKYMNEVPVKQPKHPPKVRRNVPRNDDTGTGQRFFTPQRHSNTPMYNPKLAPQQKKLPMNIEKRKRRPTLITI